MDRLTLENISQQPRTYKRAAMRCFPTKKGGGDAAIFLPQNAPPQTAAAKGVVVTISSKGLFVSTKSVPACNSKVLLQFQFGKRRIQCRAQVLYAQSFDSGYRPRGFGARFVEISFKDQEMIAQAIEELYRKVGG